MVDNKKEITKILNKYKPHGIFNLAADTHVDRSIDDSFNFVKNNPTNKLNENKAKCDQRCGTRIDLKPGTK